MKNIEITTVVPHSLFWTVNALYRRKADIEEVKNAMLRAIPLTANLNMWHAAWICTLLYKPFIGRSQNQPPQFIDIVDELEPLVTDEVDILQEVFTACIRARNGLAPKPWPELLAIAKRDELAQYPLRVNIAVHLIPTAKAALHKALRECSIIPIFSQ